MDTSMDNNNKKPSPSRRKEQASRATDYKEIPGGRRDSSNGKTQKIILVVIAAMIIIAYSIGAWYYNSHFWHNTYVNNTRLGEMTVEEAENTFTQDFASHKIAVTEKERTEIIDPKEAGAVIDVGTQIKDLKDAQNPWLWLFKIFGKNSKTIYLNVTYDEEALNNAVSAMECFKKENVQAPVNAYIRMGDTAYEIVPEVLGNTVKKEELIAVIGDALATCKTKINLENSDLYYLPEIYAQDKSINKGLAKANKYTHSSITYDFDYQKEVLDYDTLKDWIKINDKFKVSLKKDKVSDYVNALCKKYNTMGSSRDFTTSNGEEIHVYDGDYGWKIDAEKENEHLIKDIKSGEAVDREPEYEYKAQCRNSERDDIGDSYVEVSIKNQEVWLYVDGSCIINTSCVTGKPVDGRRTYTGIYSITYKQRNATLVGENYSSPVKWWMPFDGNRGLHDADWRNEFGGNIYKRNGSHGCVNLPPDAAEVIYKYVDTGFPVVIYDQ